LPLPGTMRAGAAQPCQVRKEATVSGGLLRRDNPGKGVLFFKLVLRICLTENKKGDSIYLGGQNYASKNDRKEDSSEENHNKSKSKKDNEEVR